jgi:hypothetical protein
LTFLSPPVRAREPVPLHRCLAGDGLLGLADLLVDAA